MRSDAIGLFWQDMQAIKIKKPPKPKRTPPEPVWLNKDYLPNLKEALAFRVQLMTTRDLTFAAENRQPLCFDCEVYGNYFLIGFKNYYTGKVWYCEKIEGCNEAKDTQLYHEFDTSMLEWILRSCYLVGFNSRSYDMIVTALALSGKSTVAIKQCSDMIIQWGEPGWQILKAYKAPQIKANHVDLIEVAPLGASLKTYGARLHTPFLQDLPFHPDTTLTAEQIAITRWYCVGKDLVSTAYLLNNLQEQLQLRQTLTDEHGIDLRSKSDAQIAEAIIAKQLTKWDGVKPKRRKALEEGTTFYFKPVPYMNYETDVMQEAFRTVCNTPLIIDINGRIPLPDQIENLKIPLGQNIFRMGIGGLHSSESKIAHHSDANWKLFDIDATSFYPMIILNQGLYPEHLGKNFLRVFHDIVQSRIQAKRAGNKAIADSLKITINGTFGKFGNPYAIMYAPDLMLQVTLSGQLSLLLLVERCVLNEIPVVSANTDGLVIKCPRNKTELLKDLILEWERQTQFSMETVEYKSIYSRDVNSYIAVTRDGEIKGKGAFANPWNNPKLTSFRCHKNPVATICLDAIEEYLKSGADYEKIIRSSTDVRKFVVVRNVKGGAVLNGQYLGKVVRWYYSTNSPGEMVYAKTGNKVATSDGCRPYMDLREIFPIDIDYDWYIENCRSLLKDLGAA